MTGAERLKILEPIILALAEYQLSPRMAIYVLIEHIKSGQPLDDILGMCACQGPVGNCPCVRRSRESALPNSLLSKTKAKLLALTQKQLLEYQANQPHVCDICKEAK